MAPLETEDLGPIVVAALRHRGAHSPMSTDGTWSDLILYASPRRLLGRNPEVRGVGLLWDDPRTFPDDERRYDVGIPIDREDISDIERPAFVIVTCPGRYMKVRHVGPYDELLRTYHDVLSNTLRYEELTLVGSPIIELYRNSPADVEEDDLVTDIYLPVIKL